MIFGVSTEKTLESGRTVDNVYYIDATSISEALGYGNDIALVEQTIFADTVTLTNVHAWLPGASPNQFDNQPISYVGDLVGTENLNPQMCARIRAGVANSYPSYKDYRVCVGDNNLMGTMWQPSYFSILVALCDALNNLGVIFTTRNGSILGEWVAVDTVQFRKLSKRWYNRQTNA